MNQQNAKNRTKTGKEDAVASLYLSIYLYPSSSHERGKRNVCVCVNPEGPPHASRALE